MVWLDARWSACDGCAGLRAAPELQRRRELEHFHARLTAARPFMALRLPAGRTYIVEVRARNSAGAWSDWSAPRDLRPEAGAGRRVGLREGRQLEVGVACPARRAGRSTYSTSSGAIIRYSFTGRSVALVSTLGPGRGLADVYVDGFRATTINLSVVDPHHAPGRVHPDLVEQRRSRDLAAAALVGARRRRRGGGPELAGRPPPGSRPPAG